MAGRQRMYARTSPARPQSIRLRNLNGCYRDSRGQGLMLVPTALTFRRGVVQNMCEAHVLQHPSPLWRGEAAQGVLEGLWNNAQSALFHNPSKTTQASQARVCSMLRIRHTLISTSSHQSFLCTCSLFVS